MATISRPPAGTTTAAVDVEELEDRPFGFTAATLIGGGFGVALYGVLTFVVERFASTQAAFTISKDVGPLSGKTTYAVIGWLIGWAILVLVLRGRDVSERATYWISGVLVALGFVLTFPPTWKLLGA
ncbi:MAG TPA: hypothetical protein VLW53_13045 [Candidatus Eisenbacteria bacterium]|nr:hypothetical protein [Candidatus Eisenbacteria bacterium]